MGALRFKEGFLVEVFGFGEGFSFSVVSVDELVFGLDGDCGCSGMDGVLLGCDVRGSEVEAKSGSVSD